MNAPAERRGVILVRNVDLDVWDEFKELPKNATPEEKLGPYLTEVLRREVEQQKQRRS